MRHFPQSEIRPSRAQLRRVCAKSCKEGKSPNWMHATYSEVQEKPNIQPQGRLCGFKAPSPRRKMRQRKVYQTYTNVIKPSAKQQVDMLKTKRIKPSLKPGTRRYKNGCKPSSTYTFRSALVYFLRHISMHNLLPLWRSSPVCTTIYTKN